MSALVCLVADKNMEAVFSALLDKRRRPALGIGDFQVEIQVHPQRDPGCYHTGPEWLQGILDERDARGLLVFDQAWDGNPHSSALETEGVVRQRFDSLGIGGRAEVVVIEPELEVWVWSASPHVDEVFGWGGVDPPLRQWLRQQGLWPPGYPKPPDPKAAVESVLRRRRIPRSSSLYRRLAARVSLQGCRDPAFNRLRRLLIGWFASQGIDAG